MLVQMVDNAEMTGLPLAVTVYAAAYLAGTGRSLQTSYQYHPGGGRGCHDIHHGQNHQQHHHQRQEEIVGGTE